MKFGDFIKDEMLDQLMVEELKYALEDIEKDRALTGALHTVIAYYSVPGTYMEGAYDDKG